MGVAATVGRFAYADAVRTQSIQRILHMLVPQPLARRRTKRFFQAALQRPLADMQRVGKRGYLVRARIECLVEQTDETFRRIRRFGGGFGIGIAVEKIRPQSL